MCFGFLISYQAPVHLFPLHTDPLSVFRGSMTMTMPLQDASVSLKNSGKKIWSMVNGGFYPRASYEWKLPGTSSDNIWKEVEFSWSTSWWSVTSYWFGVHVSHLIQWLIWREEVCMLGFHLVSVTALSFWFILSSFMQGHFIANIWMKESQARQSS